jgi:hypothetical protein
MALAQHVTKLFVALPWALAASRVIVYSQARNNAAQLAVRLAETA